MREDIMKVIKLIILLIVIAYLVLGCWVNYQIWHSLTEPFSVILAVIPLILLLNIFGYEKLSVSNAILILLAVTINGIIIYSYKDSPQHEAVWVFASQLFISWGMFGFSKLISKFSHNKSLHSGAAKLRR